MKIGIIGAGKVGFSLGKLFENGGVSLSGYYSRSRESADEAAAFTGSRHYGSLEDIVHDSGALFLTVPDGAIGGVWRSLCGFDLHGKYVCHCSGALSADEAFPGAAEMGARALSVHPLFPVSDKYDAYKELRGAYFCLEGDEGGVELFGSMLGELGVNVQTIPPDGKARYHAGCVMASNFICALTQESVDLLVSCGFTQDGALRALAPLMRNNLEHIIAKGPVEALTGPVERNDAGTLRRHLANIDLPERRMLYKLLSARLSALAKQKHPEKDYSEIDSLTKIKYGSD